jgi:large subunit ribosomal protein L14e
MMEIGRVCMKIAGRDANKMCVVVDVFEDNYVLVDGETRRKKVNIRHLEPLNNVVKIKKDASRADVKKVFSELGYGFFEPKTRKVEPRVKRVKAKKVYEEKPKKEVKKEKPVESEKKKEPESKKEETSKE